jgi:hypothetical protein
MPTPASAAAEPGEPRDGRTNEAKKVPTAIANIGRRGGRAPTR